MDDARATVLEARLHHPNPGVRRDAVVELSRIAQEDDPTGVLWVLHDPRLGYPPVEPGTIAHKIETLSPEARSSYGQEVLAHLARERGPAAEVLVYSLGYTAGADVVEPLAGFLGDPSLRAGASDALVVLHLRGLPLDDLAPAVRQALAADDPATRAAAAEVLGRLGDRGSVGLLVPLLRDPDVDVGVRAARALGWIGDAGAVKGLADVLPSGADPVRREAVVALGALRSPAALPPLIRLLDDPDPNLKEEAADAIGQIGGTTATEALVHLLEREDAWLQSVALRALAVARDPETAGVVRRFLSSPNEELRFQAAVVLDRLGDPSGRELLEARVERAIDQIQSDDPVRRREGIRVIDQVAQRDFGYDPASVTANREAVGRIPSWFQNWREQRRGSPGVADSPPIVADNEFESTPATDGLIQATARLDNPLLPVGAPVSRALRVDLRATESPPHRSPVNISVVFDKSGSMKADNKIGFIREASRLLVDNLLPADSISLVAYDQEVRVLSHQALAVNRGLLSSWFEDLEADGYTNLSGGLLRGYSELGTAQERSGFRRVLLLTDGLANRGITDPSKLVDVARQYRRRGITLSTVGVGDDFDEELLRDLAFAGGGQYYFVAQPEEIPRIIGEELDGLLRVLAQNVSVELAFASGIDALRVYGADHQWEGENLQILAGDLHPGDVRTVLVPLEITGRPQGSLQVADMRVTYDRTTGTIGHVEKATGVLAEATTDDQRLEAAWDDDVRLYRLLFEGLREIALAARHQDRDHLLAARKILDEHLEAMEQHAVETADPVFYNGVSLLRHYGMMLASLLEDTERGKRHAAALQRICKCAVYSEYLVQQNRAAELHSDKLRGGQ